MSFFGIDLSGLRGLLNPVHRMNKGKGYRHFSNKVAKGRVRNKIAQRSRRINRLRNK